jgi:hypothetical protein
VPLAICEATESGQASLPRLVMDAPTPPRHGFQRFTVGQWKLGPLAPASEDPCAKPRLAFQMRQRNAGVSFASNE